MLLGELPHAPIEALGHWLAFHRFKLATKLTGFFFLSSLSAVRSHWRAPTCPPRSPLLLHLSSAGYNPYSNLPSPPFSAVHGQWQEPTCSTCLWTRSTTGPDSHSPRCIPKRQELDGGYWFKGCLLLVSVTGFCYGHVSLSIEWVWVGLLAHACLPMRVCACVSAHACLPTRVCSCVSAHAHLPLLLLPRRLLVAASAAANAAAACLASPWPPIPSTLSSIAPPPPPMPPAPVAYSSPQPPPLLPRLLSSGLTYVHTQPHIPAWELRTTSQCTPCKVEEVEVAVPH